MRNPVDSDQLGRYSLTYLRVVVRLAKHGESGVGVEIDESRAYDLAFGVDGMCRLNAGVVAPMDGDSIVVHQDRSPEARAAGTVHDHSVVDRKIEHTSLQTNRNLPIRIRRIFYQYLPAILLERF